MWYWRRWRRVCPVRRDRRRQLRWAATRAGGSCSSRERKCPSRVCSMTVVMGTGTLVTCMSMFSFSTCTRVSLSSVRVRLSRLQICLQHVRVRFSRKLLWLKIKELEWKNWMFVKVSEFFYLKFCITLRNLSCAFLILRKVRLIGSILNFNR